jgi:UDP-N-acetylmuramate--alanine ligase
MRTTADHAGDRPKDREAPGAALVRSAATDRIPALADLGRVHIMGIAGSGMNALVRILFDRGVPVSGCEVRESITVAGCERSARRRHRPLPAAP